MAEPGWGGRDSGKPVVVVGGQVCKEKKLVREVCFDSSECCGWGRNLQ